MILKSHIVFTIFSLFIISLIMAPQNAFAVTPIYSGSAGEISINSTFWSDPSDLAADYETYLYATGYLTSPGQSKTAQQKAAAQLNIASGLNTYAVNSGIVPFEYDDSSNDFESWETPIMYCISGGWPENCSDIGVPPYLQLPGTGAQDVQLFVLTKGGGSTNIYLSSATAFVKGNQLPEIDTVNVPSTVSSLNVAISFSGKDADSSGTADADIRFYSITESIPSSKANIVWTAYTPGQTQSVQHTFSSTGSKELFIWFKDKDGGITTHTPDIPTLWQDTADPTLFYDDFPIGSVEIEDSSGNTPGTLADWSFDTADYGLTLNDMFGNAYLDQSAKIYKVNIPGDGVYGAWAWIAANNVQGTGINVTVGSGSTIGGVSNCIMGISGQVKCPSTGSTSSSVPIPIISPTDSSGTFEFQAGNPQPVCIINHPGFLNAKIYYTTDGSTPTITPGDLYSGCFDVSQFTSLSNPTATVIAMSVNEITKAGGVKFIKTPTGGTGTGLINTVKSIFKVKEKEKKSESKSSLGNTRYNLKDILENITKKAFASSHIKTSGLAAMTFKEVVTLPTQLFPPTISPTGGTGPSFAYPKDDATVHAFLSHPDYPSDPKVSLWYDLDPWDTTPAVQYTVGPIVMTETTTLSIEARKFDTLTGKDIRGHRDYPTFNFNLPITSRNVYGPGTHSFTAPANIFPDFFVYAIGGGGGGSGGFSWVQEQVNATTGVGKYGKGSGGGQGAYLEAIIDTSPGDVFNINTGAGGAAGGEGLYYRYYDGSNWQTNYWNVGTLALAKNSFADGSDGGRGGNTSLSFKGVELFNINGGEGALAAFTWTYHAQGVIHVTPSVDGMGGSIGSTPSSSITITRPGDSAAGFNGGGSNGGSVGSSWYHWPAFDHSSDSTANLTNPNTKDHDKEYRLPWKVTCLCYPLDTAAHNASHSPNPATVKGRDGGAGAGGGGGARSGLGYKFIDGASANNSFFEQSASSGQASRGGKGGNGFLVLDWSWLFIGTP